MYSRRPVATQTYRGSKCIFPSLEVAEVGGVARHLMTINQVLLDILLSNYGHHARPPDFTEAVCCRIIWVTPNDHLRKAPLVGRREGPGHLKRGNGLPWTEENCEGGGKVVIFMGGLIIVG